MVWDCLRDNLLIWPVFRKTRYADELVAVASLATVPSRAAIVYGVLPGRWFILYELMRRALFRPVEHHQLGKDFISHVFLQLRPVPDDNRLAN
jgi:hypothetical protein